MIKEKIVDALNAQINLEYHSSYTYLAMSKYFLEQNLNGFAHWMRIQAQEELMHGMKVFDFIDERDGIIDFTDIKKPRQAWDGPLDVFQDALNNEQAVSESIYNIVDLCLTERDHATHTFLQWFVAEQVEEEATIRQVIDDLKLIDNDGNGLFLLDRDLGQRTFATAEQAPTADGQAGA